MITVMVDKVKILQEVARGGRGEGEREEGGRGGGEGGEGEGMLSCEVGL